MAPSIESMLQYDEEAIITARRAENLKPTALSWHGETLEPQSARKNIRADMHISGLPEA
jgi:hypothetical protein